MKQTILDKLLNIILWSGIGMFLVLFMIILHKFVFPNYLFPKITEEVAPIEVLIHACIFSPIVEEFLWRFLPFEILKNTILFKENKYKIAILIGCLFGVAHGGFINILVQGIGGSVFGIIYIKNRMSYTSSIIAHSLYNITMLIIIPTIIQ